MTKPKAISLFSGGGGLDLGIEAAGFATQLSVDIDSYSVSTIKANANQPFGPEGEVLFADTKVLQADITKVSGRELMHESGIKPGGLDLLYGGPPCQAFSVFGKRMGTLDPRGNLIYEFARLVDETSPRAFLFENVQGLLTVEGGVVYDNLIQLLSTRATGYRVTPVVVDAASFGVPQFRQRVFLIGTRDEIELPSLVPTHYDPLDSQADVVGMRPYRTAGEALHNLPLPKPGVDAQVRNHVGRRHSQRIIDRYRALAHGERDPVTRINKLSPDRPSFTIIVGSDNGGGKEHVHPFEPRALTQRESARMQTFPDTWEFKGQGRHVIRQVGNAVPPVLAARIGIHVAKHGFGLNADLTYDQILAKLNLDYLLEAQAHPVGGQPGQPDCTETTSLGPKTEPIEYLSGH